MKIYCADFNGVLTDLRTLIGPTHLTNPRDADTWVVWQDVLGSYGDLIKTAKRLGYDKPTFVVQHGRGATSDYDKPNSYPLSADYFLCWGKNDYDRLKRLGLGDKGTVVGCPLNTLRRPKIPHQEKVVLFAPVNTGKEEPENIAVYYELLKLKYAKAGARLLNLKDALKDKWTMTSNNACQEFDVVAKLLPWHDKNMYHGRVLVGSQYDSGNNKLIFELMRNVDAVVGVDEGCTEIFAMANDVPVIIVDGFKYRQYREDERSYVVTEPYKTKGAVHVPLNGLSQAIDYALAHPEHLREERAEVAEIEMGISYGDATKNIYDFIRSKVKELAEA